MKLKEGVTLQRVVLCNDGDDLVVGSSTGRLLRLSVNEENLPVMGRNAQGPVLLRLLPGEEVIGAAAGTADCSLLLASRQGILRRLSVDQIRRCHRGDLGQICVRFEQRGDQLIDLREGQCSVVAIVLNDHRSQRINNDELLSSLSLALSNEGGVTELVVLRT